MKRLLLLAGLGVVLAPLAALGQAEDTALSWHKGCQTTGNTTKTLGPGTVLCWRPDTNSDASPIFSASSVDNFDLHVIGDYNGDATATTTTFTLQVCSSLAPAGNDTVKNNACSIVEGTSAVAADNGINGAPGHLFMRVIGNSDATIADPEVQLTGGQRAGP